MPDIASPAAPLARKFPALAVPILVLVCTLAVTYVYSRVESAERQRDLRTYFEFRVEEVSRQIANRIDTYAEVLRASGGLFRASDNVTRSDFTEFVEALALADFYPGVQGVGYAQTIAPEALASHVASIRSEGFSNYSVYPEGLRELYTSIVYLEPFSDRNLRAFGYDMYSEAVRQSAMQRAADNDALAMSGSVRLVQESGVNEQAGFLMYMPVYDAHSPHMTVAERRQNLVGWAYSAFRMDDFMLGAQGDFLSDLGIEIYDGESAKPESLMYDSHQSADEKSEALPPLEQEILLPVVDHVWTLRIHSLPSLSRRVDIDNVAYINAIGILASFSLSLIVWLLITGRQRALLYARNLHKELIYEKEKLQNIITGTRVGTWEWNVQTGETVFNEYWAAIIGYTLSELAPVSIETWSKLVHPEDNKTSEKLLERHFSGELPFYECEVRMRHKDGHWVWVLNRGKLASRTEDGKPLRMFGTHEDISSRKETEVNLLFDLQHDALTGIPNRLLYLDRLQRSILTAKRQATQLAVLFLDLDNFKEINDSQGHDAGDQVLMDVAQLMTRLLRESDTVARLGGDEFVVLLPLIEDQTHALNVAEKLRMAVAEQFPAVGDVPALSISVGVALYPEDGLDAETLMKNADTAMYQAKNAGKNQVRLHQGEIAGS